MRKKEADPHSQCEKEKHIFKSLFDLKCVCGKIAARPPMYIDYIGMRHHKKQARNLDKVLEKIAKDMKANDRT